MFEADPQYRDAVAREIRTAFAAEKAALLGRKYNPSGRHRGFAQWQKAADQAIALGAPPDGYVRAAFRHCRMSTGPFPNAMAGKAAAGWWREYSNLRPNAGAENAGDVLSGPSSQAKEYLDQVTYALVQLRKMTGEEGIPLGPQSLEMVRHGMLPCLTSPVRAGLAYPDPDTAGFYGREIMADMARRPGIVRAMAEVGLDMPGIMAWLRKGK